MVRLKKSEIIIAPALVQKGYSRVSVPVDPIESLYHWVLRVISVKHLMDREYGHNHIFLEKTFIKGNKRARADVYASKDGKELWIECKPIWGLPADALQIREFYDGKIIYVIPREERVHHLENIREKEGTLRDELLENVEVWVVYLGRGTPLVGGIYTKREWQNRSS